MTDLLKNVSLFIVSSVVINAVSSWLRSDFLVAFLQDNLITLLIALLAINTTTLSVIMSKLREISDSKHADFSRSIREMRISVIEQVWLIVAGAIISIVKSSKLLASSVGRDAQFVLDTLLVAVFLYAIYILYDTANGIFVILKHENQ